MDIDTFYQNGDMSFGMDGRIAFADEGFLYLGGRRRARKAAEKAASPQGSRSEQVAGWFPISDDCAALEESIFKAKKTIENNNIKLSNPKVKKVDRRVTTDYNNLIRSHLGTLEAKAKQLKCSEKKQAQEEGSFVATLQNIANPQGQGTATDAAQKTKKTTNMILLGVGGLVLIGGIVVLIKKARG